MIYKMACFIVGIVLILSPLKDGSASRRHSAKQKMEPA